MALKDFQFSQTSLQDFETCPRRFELRYLDRLRWPAVVSEPVEEVERLARLGAEFHHLVHQHLSGYLAGLDLEPLIATLELAAPELQSWRRNYFDHYPSLLAQAQIYPELTLSTGLHGYRLAARFDLLAVQPNGAFLIIDWKTTQHKPDRAYLAGRIQNRVYPYVLAAAGSVFNGGRPISPSAIKMIYWFPQFPDQPEQFDYDLRLFEQDEQLLIELIERVERAMAHQDFPLVEDHRPCAACVYRSLCNRGGKAGPLTAWPEEVPPESDLLEWAEIDDI